MSHVSSAATSTPVIVSKVFDPASGKFTALAINVVQSGDAYHVPVCTTDSIVAAGSSAMASTDSCQYGVQLMPVPKNAARILAHIVRTAFRAIMSVSHPSFWLGGSSATDMPMMPQQQQQQQ
ncbi:hypothetical protein GGI02_004863 [Coemansia sp. RSA 2322]|nr:hypothetical protein GGI02_004863 [Coemansia sp. RSA 2322]